MFEPKREKAEGKTFIGYIPHGANPEIYYKVTSIEELNAIQELRTKMFGDNEDKVDFVLMWNQRNIRRKKVGDVLLAFQKFVNGLPKDKRETVRLILHTQPRDEHGTDIPAMVRDIFSDIASLIVFSHVRVDSPTLNRLYNIAEATINLADNEGFGLTTHESMLAERLIICNVTGGLQDQMGFVDENGDYLHEDKHYKSDWGSNHDGRYPECGEWAFPVWPKVLTVQGSIPTPYIFSSQCDWRDAANQIRAVYDLPKEERQRRGKLAREYCLTQGLNNREMGRRFIVGLDAVMDNWTPKTKFGVYSS